MTTEFEWRKKTVPFLTCKPLHEAGFLNAFGTRQGGSEKNHRLFLKDLQPGAPVVIPKQTHSNERCVVEKPPQEEPTADALISREQNILLAIKTADCLPILVGDKKTGVFAAIHAGWRGTLGRITELTMKDLKEHFHVNLDTCIAALGPNACGNCYEVGGDIVEQYKSQFDYAERLFKMVKGKVFLDVNKANVEQLLSSGLFLENIFSTDYCPIHNTDLFFSYRREKERAGRMLSVIGRLS